MAKVSIVLPPARPANIVARELADPKYRVRRVRPRKGRGSYRRNRSADAE